MKVGVHQGSVLSPLFFIIVLEALSREFQTGCLSELQYADDLVIVVESLEKLIEKLKLLKECIETKGMRVNMVKTKLMFIERDLDSLHISDRYPCGVYRKGDGSNLL